MVYCIPKEMFSLPTTFSSQLSLSICLLLLLSISISVCPLVKLNYHSQKVSILCQRENLLFLLELSLFYAWQLQLFTISFQSACVQSFQIPSFVLLLISILVSNLRLFWALFINVFCFSSIYEFLLFECSLCRLWFHFFYSSLWLMHVYCSKKRKKEKKLMMKSISRWHKHWLLDLYHHVYIGVTCNACFWGSIWHLCIMHASILYTIRD